LAALRHRLARPALLCPGPFSPCRRRLRCRPLPHLAGPPRRPHARPPPGVTTAVRFRDTAFPTPDTASLSLPLLRPSESTVYDVPRGLPSNRVTAVQRRDENVARRPALRRPHPPEEPRFRRRGRPHPGPRDRRQHRDLEPGPRRAPLAAPLP